MVIAISGIAWGVIYWFTRKSGDEALGLRFFWRDGQQPQYRDHKDKKIFHRVLILKIRRSSPPSYSGSPLSKKDR